MLDTSTPTEITDPTNARILAVSEDRIAGFLIDPFAEIARLAELDVATVHERLRAMLAAGTIRRIRQTLMATNLAPGALVAWRVDSDAARRRLRLSLEGGSVLRPRRDSLDRRRHAGLGLSPVDDAQGAAGLLDDRALRSAHVAHRRRRVSRHAGEAPVRARRRSRASSRHGAGQQDRRARRR